MLRRPDRAGAGGTNRRRERVVLNELAPPRSNSAPLRSCLARARCNGARWGVALAIPANGGLAMRSRFWASPTPASPVATRQPFDLAVDLRLCHRPADVTPDGSDRRAESYVRAAWIRSTTNQIPATKKNHGSHVPATSVRTQTGSATCAPRSTPSEPTTPEDRNRNGEHHHVEPEPAEAMDLLDCQRSSVSSASGAMTSRVPLHPLGSRRGLDWHPNHLLSFWTRAWPSGHASGRGAARIQADSSAQPSR